MTTHSDPTIARAALAAWQRSYAAGIDVEPPRLLFGAAAESRGDADVCAAWRRWHDTKADMLFGASEWPWYAVFERARVETLASRHLPGIARNLESLERIAPIDGIGADWYRAARRSFAGDEIPQLPALAIVRARPSWRQRLVAKLTPAQKGSTSPHVIDAAQIAAALKRACDSIGDATRFAQDIAPLVRALAATQTQPALPLSGSRKKKTEQQAVAAIATPHATPVADRREAAGTAPVEPASDAPYAVFARDWDETLTTRQLDVLLAHCAGAPPIETANANTARRLAHRLQRRLVAARLRHWDFDQEDGLLDSRRLATLCTDGNNRNVFRRERESNVPEACVILLVDQSGSMRGMPQRMTVEAIDLAVRALEACRISCEVLGYTTRFGNADNPLVARWIETGRPAHPGRLNALRHVVYKTAAQPWRHTRRYLPLLANGTNSVSGENIDGEALAWAAARLRCRPEPRKALVVLSDGTPFDEATVRANGRKLLETHLHSVIAGIESAGIHLAAIGTGHDVGRFYRRALTLRQPAEVSEVLFAHLDELLTHTSAERTLS